MFEGDSLTVILWLAGGGLATMIGALTAAQGWRTKLLWTLTAAFALSLLAWILTPAASPVIQALSPVVVALVESNALAMVLIVGVVALMQSRRRPQTVASLPGAEPTEFESEVQDEPPSFAVGGNRRSKWTPDTPFKEALVYFGENSGERGYHDRLPDVLRKLISALREGKVTAWAKAHPADVEPYQIRPTFWGAGTEVTLKTDYAFSGNLNCGGYEIQLSRGELELVWPPKDSPAA